MISRAMGWCPDPLHQVAVDTRERRFLGQEHMPINTVDDCIQFILWIRNQRRMPSCTGQSFASCIDGLREKTTKLIIPVSAVSIWREGRRRSGRLAFMEGTYLSYCAEGLIQRGVDSYRPNEDDQVREALLPDMLGDELEAADHRVVATDRYRIVESGADHLDAVEDALRKGYGVVFGTSLSDAFEDINRNSFDEAKEAAGLDVLGASGKNFHAMRIAGVRRRNGVRHFLLVNSWGEEWGFDGTLWVHESVLTSQDSNDFNVLKTAV